VNEKHQRRFQSLGYLVGNTPLLEIEFNYKGQSRKIFAKAEHLNMTGTATPVFLLPPWAKRWVIR
jgi:cysteine synthase A